jgi:formate dehydrogenase
VTDRPGGRAGRATPKGRQIEDRALAEVRALLGDAPRRRDLLIEHLHRIQDAYRQISAAHLAALADEMRLAFAEVFEVATFYAHFDVVREGDPAVPPITIRVCDGLPCMMAGAEALLASCDGAFGPSVRVVRAPCVGLCDQAPVAEVGHHFVHRADRAALEAAVEAGDTHPHIPAYVDYDAYRSAGGYALLDRCARANSRPMRCSISWTRRASGAWAARASRRGANGAPCARSRGLGSWW